MLRLLEAYRDGGKITRSSPRQPANLSLARSTLVIRQYNIGGRRDFSRWHSLTRLQPLYRKG